MSADAHQAIARVPPAVLALIERLGAAGHQAVLVGGCVRDLLRGAPVRDFDVATEAEPERLLELFPDAVPIGLRHGTVMVPSQAGPVDVTAFRGDGGGDAEGAGGLEGDLSRRDFTLNAVALDPRAGRLIDPTGGLADLEAGRLRAVGSARERLGEDPLRALRAGRFVATLAVEPDAELVAALAEVAGRLDAVAPERIREELVRLLLAPGAAAGLSLLRRTGLEARLAPGVREDAAAVVDALPCELPLRLAGWLRGCRAGRILARLRFGVARTRAVEQILALHPIELRADPGSPAALRRLLARAGPGRVDEARSLRRAELVAGALPAAEARRVAADLEALEAGLAAARREGELALERRQLKVGGREVMEWLGSGPGPHVGRALRHLTDRVIEDPALNEPEALRAELERWKQTLPSRLPEGGEAAEGEDPEEAGTGKRPAGSAFSGR